MTPSLSNFLLSIGIGVAVVVIPAVIGLIFISYKDRIARGG